MPESPLPAAKPSDRSPASPRLRILFLEDSPSDAALVERELRRGGIQFEARSADTQRAFEAAFAEFQPDIVLSDYRLPDYSGLDAVAHVRAVQPDLPFILVSGTLGEERAVEALKAGVTDYMLKDRLQRLCPAIHRALAESAERRKRRKAEAQARESHDRLSLLLESVPISLYAARTESGPETTWISDNVERITGFPAARFTGEPAFWASRLHADDRTRVLAAFGEAAPGSRVSCEYRWRHADSTWLWFLDQAVVRRNGPDGPRELFGTRLDTTDHRTLEEAFRHAQKMEAVGRLAGGVAHDFNNLLTVINGYSQLLLMGLAETDPQREQIQEIGRAGERAAGLTRQLLAFSRQQATSPRVIDLNELVAGTQKLLVRLIGEDVRLNIVPAAGPACLRADPGQIEQVVMNLAVNARDAMPDGGTLTLETVPATLDDAFALEHPGTRPGPYVMLSMSDTGIGMSEEVLAHVFEPFFTTKGEGKGTGLGLATVYGIVKHCGGAIAVTSTPGRGTTFRVYFPRVEREAPDRAPGGESAPGPAGGSETVLVVEDAEPVRTAICRFLSEAGYAVLSSGRVDDALRLCRDHPGPIHLLVTDIVMPVMNGRELARRATEGRSGMKVLFLSGYTDDSGIRRGLGAPGAPFLQKPFGPDVLTRKVRDVLDNRA